MDAGAAKTRWKNAFDSKVDKTDKSP